MHNLNPKTMMNSEKYEKAVAMVELAVDMCIAQCKAGRFIAFEHPATASSWKLPCLKRLAEVPGMHSIDFDMCACGMKLSMPDGTTGRVKKRTSIFTNSPAIDGILSQRQCSKDHTHIILVNDLAKMAARYPQGLCDDLLDGMAMEETDRARTDDVVMAMADMCDAEEEAQIQDSLVGIDDLTGKTINATRVKQARVEEGLASGSTACTTTCLGARLRTIPRGSLSE